MPPLPKIGAHNNNDPSSNNGIVTGGGRVQEIVL
jgi:hypothetical protein